MRPDTCTPAVAVVTDLAAALVAAVATAAAVAAAADAAEAEAEAAVALPAHRSRRNRSRRHNRSTRIPGHRRRIRRCWGRRLVPRRTYSSKDLAAVGTMVMAASEVAASEVAVMAASVRLGLGAAEMVAGQEEVVARTSTLEPDKLLAWRTWNSTGRPGKREREPAEVVNSAAESLPERGCGVRPSMRMQKSQCASSPLRAGD